MNWDDVIDRLSDAELKPIEETYMEHYGKVLAAQRPEFHGRYFRCTYGVIKCRDVQVEVFLFPSDSHLREFLEVIGDDPWYLTAGNAVVHFPECDPENVDKILTALNSTPR